MVRKYFVRMSTVMVVLVVSLAGLSFELADAFLANAVINSGILAVFLFGVGLAFWQIFRLDREWRWVNHARDYLLQSEPEGEELTVNQDAVISPVHLPIPVMLGPLATMVRERQKLGGSLSLTPTAARYMLDSVSLRLEENSDLLRYFVGLLVFIGLLGTFWGLMGTLQSIAGVIENFSTDEQDFPRAIDSIRASLSEPIGGMSTAFSSSLFGLGGSLVLGLLSLFSNQAQNRFHKSLEEWFSSITRLGSATGTEGGEQPVYVQSLLEHTADTLDKIGWMLKQSQAQQKQSFEQMDSLNRSLEKVMENHEQIELMRQMLHGQQSLASALQKDRQESTAELREEFRLLSRILAGKSSSTD